MSTKFVSQQNRPLSVVNASLDQKMEQSWMFIGTLGAVMDVYWNIGSSHGCLLEHWEQSWMFIGTLGVVMDVYWNIGSSHGCLLEHWE